MIDPAHVEYGIRISSSVCFRIARKMRVPWLYDEFLSEALAVLPGLLEKFDPTRANLSTYLAKILSLRLIDWYRQSPETSFVGVVVPRLEQKRHKDGLVDMKAGPFGRPPFHIGSVIKEGNGRDATDRFLVDNRRSDYEIVDLKDQIRVIFRLLRRMERVILELYYFEGLTMRQIGKIVRLSESRVSQIHSETLRELEYRCRDVWL